MMRDDMRRNGIVAVLRQADVVKNKADEAADVEGRQ